MSELKIEAGDEVVLKMNDDGKWSAIVKTPRRPSTPSGSFSGTLQHFGSFDEAAASIKKMFSIS